jgi:hypothetical protein
MSKWATRSNAGLYELLAKGYFSLFMLGLWSDEKYSGTAFNNCSLISISVGVADPCGIVVAKDGCGFGLCASGDTASRMYG